MNDLKTAFWMVALTMLLLAAARLVVRLDATAVAAPVPAR